MLGSLEEFFPDLFQEKPHRSQPNTPQLNHRNKDTHNGEQSYKNKVFWRDATSKNVDINAINYANRAKGAQDLRPEHQSQSKSVVKSGNQQSLSNAPSPKKPKINPTADEYIPSDKSMLLLSYSKLKNGSEMQEKQLLQLKRMHFEMQNASEQSAKKASFLHLKGKLKHNHHLLKSLVRVEQEEMVSQKTAFQLSFQAMSNKFKTIRLDNKLRTMDDFSSQFKTMRFPLFLNKKQLTLRSEKFSYQKVKENLANSISSKELNLKIVEENTKKWVKLRSKSVQSQQNKRKKLTPAAKSLQLRQTEQSRKKIIGNISKLVNRSKSGGRTGDQSLPSRKYSYTYTLRKSSYMSNS